MLDQIAPTVGAALIAEERLTGEWRSTIGRFLDQQPAWSDFPFLVLTTRDEVTSAPLEYLQHVANVTRISRPVRIRTLISNVESCLRDRQRQRTVRDLLESVEDRERRFRELADSMPIIVFTMTPGGEIDYGNQQASESLGPEPNLGRVGLRRMIHAADYRDALWSWKQAMNTGKDFQAEFRIRNERTGQFRWHLSRAVPIRDHTGGIARWYGTCTDIDAQKRHQQHLNAALEQAALASVSKSEFIANMSHEIRTPMTAVLGYVELLESLEKDSEKLGYLQTIHRNGVFLIDIINDILDLSKIEAGKLDISVQDVDTHTVLQDVYAMMRGRAEEKSLKFDIQVSTKIPREIRTDPKRLRQILINLIGNAIKFTHHGGVTLSLAFQGNELIYEVIDTGIGISSNDQSRLFQAFSQVDASAGREYGGTGLGLAISRRLAHMLKGEIEVESMSQRGSCFRLRIHVVESDRSDLIAPGLESVVQVPEQRTQDITLCCRVLVVDDRRDIRQLAGHLLRRAGAEVDFAEDGLQCSDAVRQSLGFPVRYDLVLLDMQMPRMDGYRAAANLREMGFSQPIIALTADAIQGDMDRCIASGCNSYLSKPIDAEELIRVVAAFTNSTPM
ncbi:Aerobic respiration control sensor protein ArcB [Stieleria maiorica]|uniref:histidine kinase n=1 Tax=Stieleria maiorica TaxID=2795974 RepID=A0A5B9MNF4_9BACT|nr:Aerobic respiration control sensor protein ArcB [Stieleria maiorica]